MKIENIDIDKLIPYINNARKHSEDQISKIASSIKEFKFINPVIIDKDNGLIAGHGRLAAAHKLGLKKIPCIRADHLTGAQKKAYIIADNRLAELAEWDTELLKLEIEDLIELDYNIDEIGMDDSYLKKLHIDFDAEFIPKLPDEDEENKSKEINLQIIIECESFEQQQELFLELRDRGFKVK